MESLQIIGHRGAAGLAPENSIAAIKAGLAAGADAVEIDVRVSGGVLVLAHDNRDIKPDSLPLDKAIAASGKAPLMVEIKDRESVELLSREILESTKPVNEWMVTSFLHEELRKFKELCPNVSLWPTAYRHPVKIVRAARQLEAQGININAWGLNPLTYWLARRYGFKIMVYANTYAFIVNNPRAVRLLKKFYPEIIISTDRPDLIVPVVRS